MFIGQYILDEKGEPVPCSDSITWARWMETAERHVGNDWVGAFHVSTVFLGVDHQFGDGPPILWETMIFGAPAEHALADYHQRYTSRAAALAGHAEALELVRRAVN